MIVVSMLGKKLGIYLSAVLLTYLLAVVSASWHVATSLASMGVAISPADRLTMTASDLAGMAPLFLPLIAGGLLLAFLVTALLHHWLQRAQALLYMLAGASAMIAMHLLIEVSFGLALVAIARSPAGLAVQAAAGAFGGLLYIALNRRLETEGTG